MKRMHKGVCFLHPFPTAFSSFFCLTTSRRLLIGHRKPDTDSVVSAMAYAALHNALGDNILLISPASENPFVSSVYIKWYI